MWHEKTGYSTEESVREQFFIFRIPAQGRVIYDEQPNQPSNMEVPGNRLAQEVYHSGPLSKAEPEIENKIRVGLEPKTHHINFRKRHCQHLPQTGQHEVVSFIN